MNTPASSPLMAQQAALLNALMAPHGQMASAMADLQARLNAGDPLAPRGLQAYRANGHALAERCLRAAYPVINMMLGSNSFNALAHDLWHHQPPTQGDLSRWGDGLPAFLASKPALAEVPYLPDVARAEWAYHAVAGMSDASPDPASFARLGGEEPSGLTLTLAPGTTLISSAFPVATLVLAHRFQEPSLAEAAQKLRAHTAETALVWRNGLRPCLSLISPVEAALIHSFLLGLNVSAACDTALAVELNDAETFDFSQWLTQAVGRGLVTGVHDVSRLSAQESQ